MDLKPSVEILNTTAQFVFIPVLAWDQILP